LSRGELQPDSPSTHPDAAAGYVIMEQTEYPGMSRTNTICVTTVLLETGMVPMPEPVTELTLESQAGLIHVRADCAQGKLKLVTFRNVPAFAVHLDFYHEGILGTIFTGRLLEETRVGPCRSPNDRRSGMDHWLLQLCRGGRRLVPGELYRRRHMVSRWYQWPVNRQLAD
jgi:proline racemase